MEKRICILNDAQIRQKIRRIAYQILENNLNDDKIYIGGIGERGGILAKLIFEQLGSFEEINADLFTITAEKGKVYLNISPEQFQNKTIIIIDDVLNTGKTLMDVLLAIAPHAPKRIETCFLAQRNHRMFPVKGDYVGISMATTFQEHIYFDAGDPQKLSVYLE